MRTAFVLLFLAVGCAQSDPTSSGFPPSAPASEAVAHQTREPMTTSAAGAAAEASTTPEPAVSIDDRYVPHGDFCDPTTTEDLQARDFAFDGSLISLMPGQMDTNFGTTLNIATFEVHEWFKPSHGPLTTDLEVFGFLLRGTTSFPALRVGDRLLVSGLGNRPNDCGFTRTYESDLASQWATAFDSH